MVVSVIGSSYIVDRECVWDDDISKKEITDNVKIIPEWTNCIDYVQTSIIQGNAGVSLS